MPGPREVSAAAPERVSGNIRTSQMVIGITETLRAQASSAGDTEFQAEFVIFAAPTFLAPIFSRIFRSTAISSISLAHRQPHARSLSDPAAAKPAWDTVFLDSPTLGYVDAMHQSLRMHVDRTVWTFYWALAEGAPAQNRQLLLDKIGAY